MLQTDWAAVIVLTGAAAIVLRSVVRMVNGAPKRQVATAEGTPKKKNSTIIITENQTKATRIEKRSGLEALSKMIEATGAE